MRHPGIAHAEPDGVVLAPIDIRPTLMGDGETDNLLVTLGEPPRGETDERNNQSLCGQAG